MKKIAALLAVCIAFVSPVGAAEIVVFAAASLKGPLDRIAGDDVVVSYGGSGTLARQVSLGAPADVVILANADWMDVLQDGGYILPDSRTDILGNRLVLLAADPALIPLTEAGLAAALGEGRLAMGFTASVPAGIYGKAALASLGLWDGVASQVAEVDNVRAAVALVARGEVPLAVGYATDAQLVAGIFEVASFPTDSHPPIRYVAAATGLDGARFLERLQSEDAQAIFAEAGFLSVNAE